jgi:GNAT superfamily N-acetyltransferase
MESEPSTDVEGLPVRPRPDGSDIRKFTDANVLRVAQALARAFDDDPFWSWVYWDDSRRMRRLVRGFDLYLRKVWLPLDECYATDRLIGAALWMPPDTWHLSAFQQARLLPAMAAVAGRHLPRLLGVINAVESKHPPDPHYYLPFIGVEPEWQGRGFGTALMRPILERCDRERVPAYLEASTPRNRALYERNGFKAVEEVTVAKDSPPLWRMWREPAGPK